jgi:hypothetical protein
MQLACDELWQQSWQFNDYKSCTGALFALTVTNVPTQAEPPLPGNFCRAPAVAVHSRGAPERPQARSGPLFPPAFFGPHYQQTPLAVEVAFGAHTHSTQQLHTRLVYIYYTHTRNQAGTLASRVMCSGHVRSPAGMRRETAVRT